jgi:hypothetical protein
MLSADPQQVRLATKEIIQLTKNGQGDSIKDKEEAAKYILDKEEEEKNQEIEIAKTRELVKSFHQNLEKSFEDLKNGLQKILNDFFEKDKMMTLLNFQIPEVSKEFRNLVLAVDSPHFEKMLDQAFSRKKIVKKEIQKEDLIRYSKEETSTKMGELKNNLEKTITFNLKEVCQRLENPLSVKNPIFFINDFVLWNRRHEKNKTK